MRSRWRRLSMRWSLRTLSKSAGFSIRIRDARIVPDFFLDLVLPYSDTKGNI